MRPLVAMLAALGLLAAPPVADGVWFFRNDDPAYAQLRIPPSVRAAPERPRRLVVFRGGRVVLDRGLADEVRPAAGTGGAPLEEVLETVELAPDHSAALLHTLLARSDPQAPQGVRVVATRLRWIDPQHPRGRWSVTLEDGRWLRLARVLPRGRGALVSTAREADSLGDLRWYEPDGRLHWSMREEEAMVRAIEPTRKGGFVLVELVYPERRGGPHRGLLVFDLLANRHWTYAWRYGDEREPVDFRLDDTGKLELECPDATYVYDRFGRLIERHRH